MAIEFRCEYCESLLRVADDRAGLSFRCPCCDQRVWIPFETEVPRSGFLSRILPSYAERLEVSARDVPQEDVRSDVMGTLACQQCGKQVAIDDDLCQSCDGIEDLHAVSTASFFEIMRVSWSVFTTYLGLCLMATAVDLLSTLIAAVIVLIPTLICVTMMNQVAPAMAVAASIVVFCCGGIVTLSATTVGHYRFFLSLVRGRPIAFGDMLRFDRYVGRLAVASTMFWSLVVAGAIAGIVPGLLILIFFWPYGRLIVDRDLTVGESFFEAFRLTSENSRTSVCLFVTYAAALISSNSVPLLGFFVAVPFFGVVHSVAYQAFHRRSIPVAP